MKKRVIACISLFVFILAGSALAATPEVYTNHGKISAINLEHGTVVVEIPVEQGLMTVGGPVIPEARLRIAGEKADLNDFQVGEQVRVSWEKTDETLLIHQLVASK